MQFHKDISLVKQRRNVIAISCKSGYSFFILIQNSELLIELKVLSSSVRWWFNKLKGFFMGKGCLFVFNRRVHNPLKNRFVYCFCAMYTFLMYQLEKVLLLCTVHISDVPAGKCSVSVHSTHFWCTVWKMFCFCALYTFLVYGLRSVLFLCIVHISDIPSGKCSVSVHSTHFWCAIWEVFCFCAQYTFLVYCLESVLFLCTVHISDVPSWKCSVSVHSTHCWCTVWEVFCSCAQYTFLVYRLESVLFLCTVHISGVPSGKCSVSVHSAHFWCPNLWYLYNRFLVQVLCCSHRFVLLAPFCVARTILCCSHRFTVILPWYRQFQSLSNL